MELCLDGDISGVLLREQESWRLINHIGHALCRVHESEWMHLDVSPGNILRSANCFKLADFGTLTKVGQFVEGCEGAGPYVSPEALAFPFGLYEVTGQTDIFSLGVVLLEVLTRQLAPRGGSDGYGRLRREELGLGRGLYQCECSQELKEFVNLMLVMDPKKRPTAQMLVERSEVRF
jgi:serine/threonine protein kinase